MYAIWIHIYHSISQLLNFKKFYKYYIIILLQFKKKYFLKNSSYYNLIYDLNFVENKIIQCILFFFQQLYKDKLFLNFINNNYTSERVYNLQTSIFKNNFFKNFKLKKNYIFKHYKYFFIFFNIFNFNLKKNLFFNTYTIFTIWYNILTINSIFFFKNKIIKIYKIKFFFVKLIHNFLPKFFLFNSFNNNFLNNIKNKKNEFFNNDYEDFNFFFFYNYTFNNYLFSWKFVKKNNLKFYYLIKYYNTMYFYFINNFKFFLFFYKFFKNFIISFFIGIFFLYYTFFLFKLSFIKTLANWLCFGLFIFWLLSTFNFFLKRYKFGKYTSAIQRFWKRAFMCFWMIEGFLFIIFFYYLLNASGEPYFMYDTFGLYINNLLSIKNFLYINFLIILLINLFTYLLINIKFSSFKKNIYLFLIVTLIYIYLLFIESYQFYYLLNFYIDYIWNFSEYDGIWELDFDIPRIRNKNHYITLIIVAKFWHYIFIFASWVFFIIKSIEIGRVRYAFLSMNLQNIILFYLMGWLNIYLWLKWIFHRFIDQTYYWFFTSFRPITFNIIINDFIYFIYNIFNLNFYFYKNKINNTFFYFNNLNKFIL